MAANDEFRDLFVNKRFRVTFSSGEQVDTGRIKEIFYKTDGSPLVLCGTLGVFIWSNINRLEEYQ